MLVYLSDTLRTRVARFVLVPTWEARSGRPYTAAAMPKSIACLSKNGRPRLQNLVTYHEKPVRLVRAHQRSLGNEHHVFFYMMLLLFLCHISYLGGILRMLPALMLGVDNCTRQDGLELPPLFFNSCLVLAPKAYVDLCLRLFSLLIHTLLLSTCLRSFHQKPLSLPSRSLGPLRATHTHT